MAKKSKPKPKQKPKGSQKKPKKKKSFQRKKPTKAELGQMAQIEVGRLECELIETPWYRPLYRMWCRQRIKRIKEIYKL